MGRVDNQRPVGREPAYQLVRAAGNTRLTLQAVAAGAPDDVAGRTGSEVVNRIGGAAEIRAFTLGPANLSEIGQDTQAPDQCGGVAHPFEAPETGAASRDADLA